jgi:regulatory protein
MAEDLLLAKAEKKAYRLLALRAHSEKELRAKLRRGGFTESVIARVVERCRGLGYLNDGNYARQRVRELAVNRLAGNRRIAFDLQERGIPEDLSREVIGEIRGEISEEEAIGRLIRKKVRGMAVAAMDDRQKARLARSLTGKGFPAGLIFKKLKGSEGEEVHDDDGN